MYGQDGLVKKFLKRKYGPNSKESLFDDKQAEKFLFENILTGEFYNSFVAQEAIDREEMTYAFIPEYSEFISNFYYCHDRAMLRWDGRYVWEDKSMAAAFGAYRPDQCSIFVEYLAYLLQHVKYHSNIVKKSLEGEYGDADKYRLNVELALKHNWITKDDYDMVTLKY